MEPSQLIGRVTTPFGEAFVYVGRYRVGGAIAIQLVGTGTGEPLGVFSTNLVPYGARVGDTEFCAKVWSENEPLVAPLLASGLFEDTGRVEPTGYVLAPVWRIKHPEHVPPQNEASSASVGGSADMIEAEFIDGTPVSDDCLTSASLLVRDAALATDMLGEDALEAASRGTSRDAREAATAQKCCCVCGREVFDESESAFGACAQCLNNVRRDPETFVEQALPEGKYVVRAYAGRKGDVDAPYPTLQEAIAAFQAAPVNSDPRVIYEGRTLAALDRKLVPVFSDDEAQRIHRELFGGFVLRTYGGFDKGNVNTAHPTLEAALAAFAAAPSNVFPRVLQDGRIVAELDLEAGLAPLFGDDEVQRIFRRMFDQGRLDREHVQS